MNKTCLIVYGVKQNDQKFRPGTTSPDKHWAYRLIDSYSKYDARRHSTIYPKGIGIHWLNQEPALSVRMSSDLWKHDENCFESLMSFIRENDLSYEFPRAMEECTTCEGHNSCISNECKIPEVPARVLQEDKYDCAA